jgi:chromosome partitioning protein
VAAEVKRHFPNELCKTIIPRTVRLAEAPSFGQPITEFDPNSKGARAYRALAEEIMNG